MQSFESAGSFAKFLSQESNPVEKLADNMSKRAACSILERLSLEIDVGSPLNKSKALGRLISRKLSSEKNIEVFEQKVLFLQNTATKNPEEALSTVLWAVCSLIEGNIKGLQQVHIQTCLEYILSTFDDVILFTERDAELLDFAFHHSILFARRYVRFLCLQLSQNSAAASQLKCICAKGHASRALVKEIAEYMGILSTLYARKML